MKVGAVVVASGLSRRTGEFIPTKKVGAISAAKRVVSSLQQAGAEPVVVVTGNQADVIEKELSKSGVVFLHNKDYMTSQMFDSVKLGLHYIKDKCDRVLFTISDAPLFNTQTIDKLFRSDADIAIPVFKGRKGHPLLIKTVVIPRILETKSDSGLGGAIRASGLKTELVPVEDEGVLFYTEASSPFDELVEQHNRQLFRPVYALRLAREDIFFGPEEARLMGLVRDTGSVKLACAQMSLSYSKGWYILKRINLGVGAPVVESIQGGTGGGYTILTEKGIWLLDKFSAFEADCREYAKKSFLTHFSEV